MGILDKAFKLSEHGTTVRTECRAGVVTFMTMAYIIFVQPLVLAPAMAGGFGVSAEQRAPFQGAGFSATFLSGSVATPLMAVLVNYPVCAAPGLC